MERRRSRRTKVSAPAAERSCANLPWESNTAWRVLCGARTSRRGQRGRQRNSEILAFVIREEAREHEPVAMRSKRELGRAADARLEREPHPIRIKAPRARSPGRIDAGDRERVVGEVDRFVNT